MRSEPTAPRSMVQSIVRRRRRISFVRSHCRVEARTGDTIVAYARDVPNYEWIKDRWRKSGRSRYKYFVFGSESLRLSQHSRDGFPSLKAATKAMRLALAVE